MLKKRAEPVRDAWKAEAPEDTGKYRDSIIVGTRLNKSQAREAKREGQYSAEIHIGTNDPAGIQLEFGNEHMAAQPHARQVWDGMADETLVGIGDDFAAEIEKTTQRYERKAARLAAAKG